MLLEVYGIEARIGRCGGAAAAGWLDPNSCVTAGYFFTSGQRLRLSGWKASSPGTTALMW